MPHFVKITRVDDGNATLVNLDQVTELRPSGGSGTLVLFSNGEHVSAKEAPEDIATMKTIESRSPTAG